MAAVCSWCSLEVTAHWEQQRDGLTFEQVRQEAAFWRNKWYEDDRAHMAILDAWNRYEVEVEKIIAAFIEWGGPDLTVEMSPTADCLRGLLDARPDRGVDYHWPVKPPCSCGHWPEEHYQSKICSSDYSMCTACDAYRAEHGEMVTR